MTNDLPSLLDSPPRDQHGRIDHGGCSHLATPAGRKMCRDHVAAVAARPIQADDHVLVWLDDAPSEMPAVVTRVNGNRYGVRMTRSGNHFSVWDDKIRKA